MSKQTQQSHTIFDALSAFTRPSTKPMIQGPTLPPKSKPTEQKNTKFTPPLLSSSPTVPENASVPSWMAFQQDDVLMNVHDLYDTQHMDLIRNAANRQINTGHQTRDLTTRTQTRNPTVVDRRTPDERRAFDTTLLPTQRSGNTPTITYQNQQTYLPQPTQQSNTPGNNTSNVFDLTQMQQTSDTDIDRIFFNCLNTIKTRVLSEVGTVEDLWHQFVMNLPEKKAIKEYRQNSEAFKNLKRYFNEPDSDLNSKSVNDLDLDFIRRGANELIEVANQFNISLVEQHDKIIALEKQKISQSIMTKLATRQTALQGIQKQITAIESRSIALQGQATLVGGIKNLENTIKIQNMNLTTSAQNLEALRSSIENYQREIKKIGESYTKERETMKNTEKEIRRYEFDLQKLKKMPQKKAIEHDIETNKAEQQQLKDKELALESEELRIAQQEGEDAIKLVRMEQMCNKSMDNVHTSLGRHLGMLHSIEPFCHYQNLPKDQNDIRQYRDNTINTFASSLESYVDTSAARRNQIAPARRNQIAPGAAPIAANTSSSPGSTRYHQRQSPGRSPRENRGMYESESPRFFASGSPKGGSPGPRGKVCDGCWNGHC